MNKHLLHQKCHHGNKEQVHSMDNKGVEGKEVFTFSVVAKEVVEIEVAVIRAEEITKEEDIIRGDITKVEDTIREEDITKVEEIEVAIIKVCLAGLFLGGGDSDSFCRYIDMIFLHL